jgi:hypothetical protein
MPGLVKPGTIDLTDPYRPLVMPSTIEDGGAALSSEVRKQGVMVPEYKATEENLVFKDEERG